MADQIERLIAAIDAVNASIQRTTGYIENRIISLGQAAAIQVASISAMLGALGVEAGGVMRGALAAITASSGNVNKSVVAVGAVPATTSIAGDIERSRAIVGTLAAATTATGAMDSPYHSILQGSAVGVSIQLTAQMFIE